MDNKPQVITFGSDTTVRLACRETDIMLWLRTDMFSSKAGIVDFWTMHPGNSVTLTNRFDDLPQWFQLCAYEVYDSFALRLLKWKKEGNQIPMDRCEGTNIWRVCEGDRIVWIGDDRPEHKGVEGILQIYDFRACALAAGETGNSSLEDFVAFGSPPQEGITEKRIKQFRAAVSYVEKMGLPRSVSLEWRLE